MVEFEDADALDETLPLDEEDDFDEEETSEDGLEETVDTENTEE